MSEKQAPDLKSFLNKKLRFSLWLTALFLFSQQSLATDQLPQFKGAEDRKAFDSEIRDQMKVISRQLGVNCATCHNTKNFSQADKPEFKIALQHIKIVQSLIDQGFDGKDKNPKADCYMCHRGSLKFDFKEPFDNMIMEPLKRPAK